MTTYSVSRVDLFGQCPRRYRYRYVERLAPLPTTAEAWVGSLVHEALERLEHQRARTGEWVEAAVALAWFAREFDRRWEIEHPREIKAGRAAARAIGEICIASRYFELVEDRLGAASRERVAIELELRFELGGRPWVGYVDLLTRDRDGSYYVEDFKTGRRSDPDGSLWWRQLGAYARGVRQLYGEAASQIGLIWHWLQDCSIARRGYDSADNARLDAWAREQIEAIEREEVWPARPSALCRWCEFVDRCPEGKERAK